MTNIVLLYLFEGPRISKFIEKEIGLEINKEERRVGIYCLMGTVIV